ncbi:hypothetical protein ACIHEI_36590 [Kitasatospora sp. NPDC051984]|uniref:hypothetical protein n=1 Tax=Kitasatospora sp. NPDC051984 TaxID=3364059 RepID=UPI0037C92849
MDQSAAANRIDQYHRLFASLSAVTAWTLSRQQEHTADADEYDTALAALSTLLRSEHIEGDGRLSALLRARRVEKHVRKLREASREQARAAESLRNAFSAHAALVAALPQQRAAKAEAKALRKGGRASDGADVKALHKSGPAAAPAPAAPAGPPRTEPVRGIGDLWQRGA